MGVALVSARDSFRDVAHADHPRYELLKFRVVYPPPPYQRGAFITASHLSGAASLFAFFLRRRCDAPLKERFLEEVSPGETCEWLSFRFIFNFPFRFRIAFRRPHGGASAELCIRLGAPTRDFIFLFVGRG